jgi:hypothetical protein
MSAAACSSLVTRHSSLFFTTRHSSLLLTHRRLASYPDPWPWSSFPFGYRQDLSLLAMDLMP